jgi:hypothetical protein
MGGGGDLRSLGSGYPILVKKPVGVPITSILKERIEKFTRSRQYEKVNLLAYVTSPLSPCSSPDPRNARLMVPYRVETWTMAGFAVSLMSSFGSGMRPVRSDLSLTRP